MKILLGLVLIAAVILGVIFLRPHSTPAQKTQIQTQDQITQTNHLRGYISDVSQSNLTVSSDKPYRFSLDKNTLVTKFVFSSLDKSAPSPQTSSVSELKKGMLVDVYADKSLDAPNLKALRIEVQIQTPSDASSSANSSPSLSH